MSPYVLQRVIAHPEKCNLFGKYVRAYHQYGLAILGRRHHSEQGKRAVSISFASVLEFQMEIRLEQLHLSLEFDSETRSILQLGQFLTVQRLIR
jgi:hypothetical protein